MEQNTVAGNTSSTGPILKVRTVCEFMCAWISLFL